MCGGLTHISVAARTLVCSSLNGELSAHAQRLTLGVKMHSTAAFLSMPNKDGIITGGRTARGFNENTMRGYPLWLPLRAKGGRHVPDDSQTILDPEENKDAVRKTCALRYLDGYPDTKVIDQQGELSSVYNAIVVHLADLCHTRDHAKSAICQR